MGKLYQFMPPGAECDHSQMSECCPGCGHYSCPCGIEWDDHSEGAFCENDRGMFYWEDDAA